MAELERLSAVPDDCAPEQLAQRMAALQLLAKFLGYLMFSPRFASSRILARNKGLSLAFEHLYSSYVESGNFALGALAVEARVAKSSAQGTLTMTVPWLCALLKTAAYDVSMPDTRTFSAALAAMHCVRAQLPRGSLGGVMAIAELDSLFSVFAPLPPMPVAALAAAASPAAALLDAPTSLLFDQCPLASCEPLERIRVALKQHAAPALVLPTKQIQTVLVAAARPVASSAALAASFLHHADADILRVDALAVAALPESAVSLVNVAASLQAAMGEAGGQVRLVFRCAARGALTQCGLG